MCNDGEDSAVDSVKLVKATPSSATRQTFQELGKRAWKERFREWLSQFAIPFFAVIKLFKFFERFKTSSKIFFEVSACSSYLYFVSDMVLTPTQNLTKSLMFLGKIQSIILYHSGSFLSNWNRRTVWPRPLPSLWSFQSCLWPSHHKQGHLGEGPRP